MTRLCATLLSMPTLVSRSSSLCSCREHKPLRTSVGIRVSEGRLSKAGFIGTAIVYVVEPLEEGHAVDEVEASTAEGSEVAYNKVDGIGFTADCAVELSVARSGLGRQRIARDMCETYRTRPDLSVCRKFVGRLRCHRSGTSSTNADHEHSRCQY